MEKKQVYPVGDLAGKFRSKDDLYRLLTQQRKHSTSYHAIHIVHYLLPTYKKCPVRFMKALIAGEKKVNNETVKLNNRLWRNTSYLQCVYLSIQNFLLVKCILSLKMTKQYRSICLIIMKDSFQTKTSFTNLCAHSTQQRCMISSSKLTSIEQWMQMTDSKRLLRLKRELQKK